jgi:ADP-ribose pyrophosphatase
MRIRVLSKVDVWLYKDFVRAQEVTLSIQYPGASPPTQRTVINIERGNSIAALLHYHDADKSWLRLVKQFRASALPEIWREASSDTFEIELQREAFVELPAVVQRNGETPEQALERLVMREGTAEKREQRHIGSFFPSPGACSERIDLYYVRIDPRPAGQAADRAIETVDLRPADFLRDIERGAIRDAKCIAAAEWIRRPDNRKLFGL